MMYNSISNEAKNNSDRFATLHKIRNKNPMVPGVYIDLSALTDGSKSITVHLNLIFFPNWSGKLSIKIYPSYRNLVICPVIPEADLEIADFKKLFNIGFHSKICSLTP